MAVRIGIEVAPSACRIVSAERPGKSGDRDTIVRAFSVTPGADEVTLAQYRGQSAALVVWGLYADHRQAVVSGGSYQRMRREAVNATREAGVDTRQMLADIAPASATKTKRGPVVIALARAGDIAAAIRPFNAAGLRVRSIVTPALALMSLSRLRRRLTAAGLAEAYVALEERQTAIALVRDGALIAARELSWGYQDERQRMRSREDVVQQLGAAIEKFFGDCGAPPSAVGQVCVCGGMPELRSMTLALTERLDVEVEPLDSLFGIDVDRLPSDDFRDCVSEMRLAWAVAADWNAPINFLRERRRRMVKTTLMRAAVVAGVATGLGLAWRIQKSALLETPKPQPKPAPAKAVPVVPRPTSPPAAATRTPPSAVAAQPPPPRVAPAPKAITLPRPVATPQQQIVLRPVPEPVKPAPEPPALPPAREPVIAPPAAAVTVGPAARARVTPAQRPQTTEVPLPFEASLGTILYGADRKLAIIDGRIVQVGDEIKGAKVVEISPNSVFFRDREGRLRRLTLEDSRK